MRLFPHSLVPLFLAILAGSSPLHAIDPGEVLRSADLLWECTSADASNGKVEMALKGQVNIGVALEGNDLRESTARGGDGKVAVLNGGALLESLSDRAPVAIDGTSMSVLLRVKGDGRPWPDGEIFARHGGHNQVLFNMHTHRGEFGFEFGVQGKPRLAARLPIPVAKVSTGGWHDVIACYDGKRLTLYLDGVPVGRKEVTGHLRGDNRTPIVLGGPVRGQIDHAALWTRALSEAEIIALSGGEKAVATRRAALRGEAEKIVGRDGLTLADKLRAARELREQIQADPLRPRWHLGTPDGIWNDINGAFFWKGRYHLFFQSIIYPSAETVAEGRDIATARKEWTHASSADLVHWIYHGTAVRPVFDGSQPRGLYSGDMVDGAEVPTLIYHIPDQGTAIARAVNPDDPELLEWKIATENPVIPSVGEPEEVVVFDPTAWKEGELYYALIGNKNHRPGYEGDCTSLYRSKDLIRWEYRGPFYRSDRKWTTEEEDCACPDFYPIGQGRHMLLMHTHRPYAQAQYYIGTWDREKEQFFPESHGKMNWPGGQLSGPETLLDGQGRRLFWGWVREARENPGKRGWGSVATMPRVLSLHEDRSLKIEPAVELEALRTHPRHQENILLPDGKETILEGVSGDSLELKLTVDMGQAKELGIVLRCSPEGEERTPFVISLADGTLRSDLTKSGAEGSYGEITEQVAPLPLGQGEDKQPLRIRVFLDRSIVEVYVNERQCLTQRIYPVRTDSLGVRLFATGGDAKVISLDAWDMLPVF